MFNTEEKRATFEQYSLPQLLFSECHKKCVNFDLKTPESEEELSCLTNCQKKTYAAFDMYMRIANYKKEQSTYHDIVDISLFTEMEVKHKHDTGNLTREMSKAEIGLIDSNALNVVARDLDLDRSTNGVRAQAL